MRLFLALPLPARLAEAAEAVAFALPDVRPVAAEAMHVTLQFLGEGDADLADAALLAAEEAAAAVRQPVWLRLAGLGSFPAGRGMSLHAVVAAEGELIALQRRLGSRLAGAGVVLPRRRFRPHVTLARAGRMSARLETALAGHVGLAPPPAAAGRLGLYRSWLRPEAAEYEILESFPLPLPVS